ncbi:MAG: cysteine desulfurase [Fibrobacteria bacterium]|nr:cysteine desulfurase [Fibrobacteria bacterium]
MGKISEGARFGLEPGRIYLDWNATAPLRASAREAWLEAGAVGWANANSLHREGRIAAEFLTRARETFASTTGTSPGEWVFTSGATESIHAAILGCAAARPTRRRIVTSLGEHAVVRSVLAGLEGQGWEIVRVGLGPDGAWSAQEVLDASHPETTGMVSLIWASNETGAVSEVEEVAKELRRRRIPLHLDAVQVPGRIPFGLSVVPATFASLSGHKFGAPKGVGALFIRRAAPWTRWMAGGEQERGRRGGTSNVAGIHSMATALAEAVVADVSAWNPLRDDFESRVLARVPGSHRVGGGVRLPQTSALRFDGVESSALLLRLDDLGIAVSSGSACTSGRTDPSPVLLGMGLTSGQAHQTIRVSFGDGTIPSDLDLLLDRLVQEVPALRGS